MFGIHFTKTVTGCSDNHYVLKQCGSKIDGPKPNTIHHGKLVFTIYDGDTKILVLPDGSVFWFFLCWNPETTLALCWWAYPTSDHMESGKLRKWGMLVWQGCQGSLFRISSFPRIPCFRVRKFPRFLGQLRNVKMLILTRFYKVFVPILP